MVNTRPTNNHDKLMKHNHKTKRISSSRRASPKPMFLRHRIPIHGVDGDRLALLGGLAAAAVMTMGAEGDSPVVIIQDGLVAAIPTAITLALVGLTEELMAS